MTDLEARAGRVPAAGEPAPSFSVRDSSGVERRLPELTQGRMLLLLFFRGHW